MLETVNKRSGILEHVFKYFIPKADLTAPFRTKRQQPLIDDAHVNHARLEVRRSLSQRCSIRLYFDCLTRYRGKSLYKRMRGTTVYVDCPTPEQAELAIEAILSFAQSLDGKWLAPSTQENQALTQSAGDSQGIGSSSAPGDQEQAVAEHSNYTQDSEVQGFSGS